MTKLEHTTGRIHWVDMSKGVLIILVVWGHLDFFASYFAGSHAYDFKGTTNFLFLPYYMPAFFVLTGLCSNFEVSVSSFVKRNFLSLIVPSVFIGTLMTHWLNSFFNEGITYLNAFDVNYRNIVLTGGVWFLAALFVAKLLFYCVHSVSLRTSHQGVVQAVCCCVLFLLGIVTYNAGVFNLWYFQHAMIALPFIAMGYFAKPHKYVFEHVITAIAGIAAIWYCRRHSYPYLNAAPAVSLSDSWLFLLLSAAGSALIFCLCMRIRQCRWLEYVGRHSMVIYLVHQPIMVFLIKFSKMLNVDAWDMSLRVIMGVVIVAITTILCVVIDIFISKHFPILKGQQTASLRK